MTLAHGALDISGFELSFAALFIVTAGAISFWNKLRLEKDLLIGAVRCVLQLLAIGYLLRIIFDVQLIWVVIGMFIAMIVFACRIIRGNVKERQVPFIVPAFFSMMGTYLVVSAIVTGAIIGVEPWWRPQYFIPLAGMIIGNSMTAMSLSLDRLFSDLRAKREEVEMRLCLGATAEESSRPIVRDALKAGMVPSINSLAGVGLVFLPGMMTGQILSGADPMLAVRYQIVVMFMIVASTTISVVAVLHIVRKRCFGPAQQLLLRP
jgi:putative ABC transport system permease protein